jgi:hypothetical protein
MGKRLKTSRLTFPLILLLITLLGFGVRVFFFIGSRFPLNDGGFFYVMVDDLLANDFVLPDFSSYNQANIPYIYPPLGFYLVALFERFTGADRLQLFRIIPLLVSTFAIPAFYFLAFQLLKEKWAALAATFAYALLPLSYKWLIQGGGVTRAFGALFGLLALAFVIRFLRSGRWRHGLMGVLFCSATILSHPEWAWFIFYSAVIIVIARWAARADARVGLRALLVGLGTAAMVLPWLLSVIVQHGGTVFLPLKDSGFARSVDLLRFFLLKWTDEALFPVLTAFTLVGIVVSAKARKWTPVVWLALTFALQGRAANQKAVVPIALLAGLGISLAVQIILRRFDRSEKKNVWIRVALAGVVLFTLLGSLVAVVDDLMPLEEAHLESIDWVRQNTPAESRILVISGEDWIWDNYAEWMTALTGRVSVAQVQGYEWLPGFSARIAQYDRLAYENSKGISALLSWIDVNNMEVDYLVLTQREAVTLCNWEDEPALHRRDALMLPGVEDVYENDRVLILDLGGAVGP